MTLLCFDVVPMLGSSPKCRARVLNSAYGLHFPTGGLTEYLVRVVFTGDYDEKQWRRWSRKRIHTNERHPLVFLCLLSFDRLRG